MKGIIAVLAVVLVLQTAFIFSQLQGANETTPASPSPLENIAITTEVKRLSTDVAALNTRVSALETGTATSTPTSALTPYFVVNPERVNVREGPGPCFSVIDTVSQGERFNIQASNIAGDWYLFCCVDGRSGWIYAHLVTVKHTDPIPVAKDIPSCPTHTPTPINTPTPTPPIGCNPHNPHGPDCDCRDFATQREAQAFFIAAGGPDRDPHDLDRDKDRIACESLP